MVSHHFSETGKVALSIISPVSGDAHCHSSNVGTSRAADASFVLGCFQRSCDDSLLNGAEKFHCYQMSKLNEVIQMTTVSVAIATNTSIPTV